MADIINYLALACILVFSVLIHVIPLMRPVGPRKLKVPPLIPSTNPSIQLSAGEGLETHLEKLGKCLSGLLEGSG